MKAPAAMTRQELYWAMQKLIPRIERAAVRDYELHGPQIESAHTRTLVNRWQTLNAEWQRRKEA